MTTACFLVDARCLRECVSASQRDSLFAASLAQLGPVAVSVSVHCGVSNGYWFRIRMVTNSIELGRQWLDKAVCSPPQID